MFYEDDVWKIVLHYPRLPRKTTYEEMFLLEERFVQWVWKGLSSCQKALSSLYSSSFQQEDQHDLVRLDSVLQRKHPTFMPRLSIFATASDVSHCEDAAHVSHKNEPGHAEEQWRQFNLPATAQQAPRLFPPPLSKIIS